MATNGLEEYEYEERDFVLPKRWYTIPKTKKQEKLLVTFVHENGCDYNFNNYINTHIPCFNDLTFVDGYREDGDTIKDYTEITFEQFKKHLLKQETMKKEIIGYKLKEDCKQYEEAAARICEYDNCKLDSASSDIDFLLNSQDKDNLQKAGVLDLWFEPVYKEEKFEAGSYVVITGYGKKLNFQGYFTVGNVYKLTKNFGTNYGDFEVEKDDANIQNGYSMSVNYFTNPDFKIEVRKATQEEIEEYNKPNITKLYFGDVKFTIKKGQDFATNEYGKVYYTEFEKLLDYLSNIPKIQKVPIYFDSITVGCQKGKFSELVKIKETIENGLKK